MNDSKDESATEVISAGMGNALELISRAEIDVQIATAHKFPRSLAMFKKRAIEMACLDEDTAASCIYSRPVGKKKDETTGKWVQSFAEGLSIRMAEIVGACFGNLRVGAMLIEQNERFVKARGMAHDLETNFASTSEVIESTVDSGGKPYSERMRVVVAKAALSKARRDATFMVVPKALCKPIETEARKVALGDATTLAARRALVLGWIGKLGIEVARVFAALGIQGEEEIGLDQLAILTGLKTSIKDGEVTVDEAFPKHIEPIKAPQAVSPATGGAGPTPAASGAVTVDATQQKQDAKAAPAETDKPTPQVAEAKISAVVAKTLRAGLKSAKTGEDEFCFAHDLKRLEDLPASKASAATTWIATQATQHQ